MSRIRSIHPGFFTDEDLVSVGFAARLMFQGLWVESDDKGIFEWKPLTLKMKIFPADNLDVDELLAELMSIDAVRVFEAAGRKYGAIRNFRKFQRPKSPNDIHPAPNEIRSYVGLTQPVSEPLPNHFPKASEIAPQMEDGGDKKEVPLSSDNGGGEAKNPAPIDLSKSLFDDGVRLLTGQGRSEKSARSFIAQCQRDFGDAATFEALNRSRSATDIVSAMKDKLGKSKSRAEYVGI